MTAVVFPSSLPQPSTLTMTPSDRLLRSSITTGLPQVAGLQRDFLGNETLVWQFTAAQMVIFVDFWKNTLILGGRWFATNWPQVTGGAGVARFTAPYQRRLIGHEYFEVTISTELMRRPPPFTPRWEADLLLYFSEADASQWQDYSIYRRRLTLHPNAGVISGQATGAFAGLGGDFAQLHGGDRTSGSYSTHSWLEAEGDIAFGASDFIIDFTCLRRSTTDLYGWNVIDNLYDGVQWPPGGFNLWFIPNSITPTNHQLVWSGISGANVREVRVENTEADIGTRTRYTISRKGRKLTSLRQGVVQFSSNVFTDGEALDPILRGFMSIAASHQNEANEFSVGNPATRQLVDGFDGVFDNFLIGHGEGAGIDSDFDPVTTVFYPPP